MGGTHGYVFTLQVQENLSVTVVASGAAENRSARQSVAQDSSGRRRGKAVAPGTVNNVSVSASSQIQLAS